MRFFFLSVYQPVFNKIYVRPAKAKPYRQTERRTDEVIPLWRFALLVPQK